MSFDLNMVIANEYHIPAYQGECNGDWYARLYYSAMGRWMLASLWDIEEMADGEGVSIQHMKNRGKEVLKGFLSAEKSSLELHQLDIISAEIYNCYRQTGCLYHKSNRVSPPQFCGADCGFVQYLRGIHPHDKGFMSGLGVFAHCEQSPITYPHQMFRLIDSPLSLWWRNFSEHRTWTPFHGTEQVEYLAHNRKQYGSYWSEQTTPHTTTSLLRDGAKGVERYYLYQWSKGKILASELPDWQVHQYEYLKIATAIWAECGALYEIAAIALLDGANTVAYYQITLSTLLPPAEMNWFTLYSWPTNWGNPADKFQSRLMSASIYPAFKAMVSHLGYQTKER